MSRLTSLFLASLVAFSFAYPFINEYDLFIDYDLEEEFGILMILMST